MGKPKQQSAYEAVMAVTLLLLLLYYFFWPNQQMIIAVILFIVVTLIFKSVASYVELLWERITKAIGWVMSRVLMSIVFIFFLTPIALIYRVSSKKKTNDENSNFVTRDYTYTSKDIENPW